MRILVTGADGFVGHHLLPRLRETGHEIVRLRRGTATVSDSDWSVPASLAAAETAPFWPAGTEAVIHLAAANPSKAEARATDAAALHEANVEGTAALARRSGREGVRRFVFLSSANVHAPRADGRPIAETDAIEPQSAYAKSKAEAEIALREALAGTPTRSVILRPAPIFGAGGRGTVAALARLAASPLPLPVGGLGGRRSLIAVEDAVEAILASLVADLDQGETFLLSGGAASPDEIVRALRAGAGRPGRILPAPKAPARALASLLGKDKAFGALTSDFVLDASLAESRLGSRPKRRLTERLQDMGQASKI